jgi:hypothetical protein
MTSIVQGFVNVQLAFSDYVGVSVIEFLVPWQSEAGGIDAVDCVVDEKTIVVGVHRLS